MEIEFRAKSIADYSDVNVKKGDWVYGYVQFSSDNGELTAWMMITNEKGKWQLRVDPKTVCQYTNCKDKHGNKIYYHDFVRKRVYGNPKEVCIVVFRKGGFCATEQTYGDSAYTLKDSQIEVLGNMFDNPNLFCLKLAMARLENNVNDYWVDAPYDN